MKKKNDDKVQLADLINDNILCELKKTEIFFYFLITLYNFVFIMLFKFN